MGRKNNAVDRKEDEASSDASQNAQKRPFGGEQELHAVALEPERSHGADLAGPLHHRHAHGVYYAHDHDHQHYGKNEQKDHVEEVLYLIIKHRKLVPGLDLHAEARIAEHL